MQQIITAQDVIIIKWFAGIIAFLVVVLNAIIGYWFKEIHKMVKDDHETLYTILSEHKIFHKKETGIK